MFIVYCLDITVGATNYDQIGTVRNFSIENSPFNMAKFRIT